MNPHEPTLRPSLGLRSIFAAALVFGVLSPLATQAQVPARFYWKSLSGANAFPVIVNQLNSNSNPFDPTQLVSDDADVDATLVIAGYARTFSLFDRSAMAAVLVPMGHISGELTVGGQSLSQSASGFGDPMIEFNINILGPPAQKTIPDALRYEPGFSIDLLADLAIPIGEYDNDQALNIGQNRWYGRVGAPIVWQLGKWVPGKRTTLEFLPAVWFFSDNDDYVGQTLETNPMFQLDAHLTRDFTEHFWGSLDSVWYTGGKSTVDGNSGDSINNIGIGFTLGYDINDNFKLTFGYKSTINDNDPEDMQIDGFMISFVYGWHKIIEGSRRLQNENE